MYGYKCLMEYEYEYVVVCANEMLWYSYSKAHVSFLSRLSLSLVYVWALRPVTNIINK